MKRHRRKLESVITTKRTKDNHPKKDIKYVDVSHKKPGKLPIHKYHPSKDHYHIVVEKNKKVGTYTSVGLTSSRKSGHHVLQEVRETTGRVTHIERSPTTDKKERYSQRAENWHLIAEDEQKAIEIVKKHKIKRPK